MNSVSTAAEKDTETNKESTMSKGFVPISSAKMARNTEHRRLLYAGYKLEEHYDGWIIIRPSGHRLDQKYKKLGNAVNRGRKDVEKYEKALQLDKLNPKMKEYWANIIFKYHDYDPLFKRGRSEIEKERKNQ